MPSRLESVAAKLPDWSPQGSEPKPLAGGITNRNFLLELKGERFVLKLDGGKTAALGIDRRREHRCASIAARLGVGPEVYRFLPGERSLVTRFIEGTPVSPKTAKRPAMLKRITASIKRVHGGPRFPGRFSAFETVRAYRRAARRRGVRLPSELSRAFARMRRIEATLGPCRKPTPCHNDLLAGNFIDDGRVIRILDWEYAGMGDPYFDLGNLAANLKLGEASRRRLLEYYEGACRPESLARLELYRRMSDLREAMWGFLQSGLSDIDFDFAGYGAKHLKRFLREAA